MNPQAANSRTSRAPRRTTVTGLSLVTVLSALLATSAGADQRSEDLFSKAPTWTAPNYDEVRTRVQQWIVESGAAQAQQAKAESIWQGEEVDGRELLERVVMSAAAVDERAAALVEVCSQPRVGTETPSFDLLADEKLAPLVRNNLRLWFGRWLSQERLYDESLEQIGGLRTEDVVDPATLLFYQAAAHHWLLDKDRGLDSLGRLLEAGEGVPQRYQALATLMRADLERLTEDNLDHIGRRMKDVERRLDLGRANEKVGQVQDGIIASLDKLIEEMEEQQQQSSQSSGSPSGEIRPADESRPSELKGPGEVDKKRLGGDGKSWGALPPKQREEALQQIGREFPSHYRDVIEDFFRRRAAEESESP